MQASNVYREHRGFDDVFRVVFDACKCEHAKYSFDFAQFDARERGSIVQLSLSVVEKNNNVKVARMLSLWGAAPLMSFLALKGSAKIGQKCSVVGELRFLS